MNKNIYIIRHCEATGQAPGAPLTKNGFEQAEKLSLFFRDKKVNQIISSPNLRAIETIELLARRLGLEIQTDQRLSERMLSAMPLTDWMEKLQATFEILDLTYPGGESSYEAMERIVHVVMEVMAGYGYRYPRKHYVVIIQTL